MWLYEDDAVDRWKRDILEEGEDGDLSLVMLLGRADSSSRDKKEDKLPLVGDVDDGPTYFCLFRAVSFMMIYNLMLNKTHTIPP